MHYAALVALVLLSAPALGQGPPHNGPRPVDPGWFALQHARVVPAPGQAIERATIVFRDGRITALGANVTPPAGATAIDCSGLTICAGWIEPFYASDVPALDEDTTDQHWNVVVQPQRNALDGALVAAGDRKALRGLGYTVVAAAPSGGILKGTSAVVLLDEPSDTDRPRVLRDHAYAVASLQRARGGYPNSEMGAIAVLRQSLADGDWYERCNRAAAAHPQLAAEAPAPSRVLAALARQRTMPLWFDTSNELQALRCLKVAAEFDRQAVVVGSGMEFRRLAALARHRAPIIVPLQLPDVPDVSTAMAADRVTLRQLQSWEHAGSNSRRLLDADVEIAWTTARLRKTGDLIARIRDAQEHGVSDAQALAAVTTVPAKLLGIADDCGTIAVGKLANLVVFEGELFGKERVVRDVWVGGVRHVTGQPSDLGLDGTWNWSGGFPGEADKGAVALTIDGAKVTCKQGDDKIDVRNVERQPHALTCQLRGAPLAGKTIWLRLHRDGDALVGTCTLASGSSLPFAATAAAADGEPDEREAGDADEGSKPAAEPDEDGKQQRNRSGKPAALPTPLGGYGFTERPAQGEFAIVGATLWSGDGRGKIANGAVHVRAGKIVFAGPGQDLPELPDSCTVIDASGKHVTTGIIDCHSHTGISRGVNESGQAVTSEVRIEDVIDPDDVNWYRQLAGGVTAVNQLHGSANVIGGQSNTVKVRFGVADPDDMRVSDGMPGIKFALGENPRRVNRRSGQNTRYPNTRMGVEGLLRDRFAAAKAYAAEMIRYRALAPKQRARTMPPRVDFELEALAEVLAGKRWIHCHSYRQDEIFMLCGLADRYGIKIGTFQHVLEGYKVADAIRKSAVGASAFSDWWGYKLEVYDAIPDNGAILHEAGVTVSFNSDSNEHARRLNTEAGKAVKYGGVAEAQALHFVTRNPAIQLGIFERTGSLTAGKDADIALWSANPLGYAAICEATWVDGRQMFSLERDRELRRRIATERERLLQKALDAKGRRRGRANDPSDAYWRAEENSIDYCCRNAEGGQR